MSKKHAPRGKRTKKARTAVEPPAQSLGEVPEMDLGRAVRGNPYAERLAREGYTLHVTRGRPRKGAETGPTVTKSVRLPPEVWQRLEERARAQGVPLHALLRTALLAWLEQVA